MRRAGIGISAHLGWAATATVSVGAAGLRVLRTDRLEIGDAADRDIREPFHIAAGFAGLERVPRPPAAESGLRKALGRQRRAAARAIAGVAAALAEEGHGLSLGGLLVGRGRAAASFEKAVASHTQVHVEEGIAVRESLRLGVEAIGAQVVLLDQKALWAEASRALGRSEEALLAALRAMRPENEGAWRKEEQSAALAAWLAWTRCGRAR